MGRVPRGTPLTEQGQSEEKLSDTSAIVPETITPSVEGYFRVPPIWVGEKPAPESVRTLNPHVHHLEIVEKELDSGIKVRVLRDGTFLFDFSSWRLAPKIVIPGYRHPGPNVPHRLAVETDKALRVAEEFSIQRARVMNVHQACLATSEQVLRRKNEPMGIPVDAQNTLKGQFFDDAVSYSENSSDVHSLSRNTANNRYTVLPNRLLPRRVVDIEVVEHSLKSLSQILHRDDTALLQLIDSLYGAARSYAERRSGEAAVVAWTVCEQLLSEAWVSLLNSAKSQGRMTRRRREKLEGLDYTASVKVEMLEIHGRIDYELYGRLEIARKARNRWVHNMKEPSYLDVRNTFGAAQVLLNKLRGVGVRLTLKDPGSGVPDWYAISGADRVNRGHS